MNMYGGHETTEETVALSHHDNNKTTVLLRKLILHTTLVYEALLCVSLEKFPIKIYIHFKSTGSYCRLEEQGSVHVLQILTPVYNQKNIQFL